MVDLVDQQEFHLDRHLEAVAVQSLMVPLEMSEEMEEEEPAIAPFSDTHLFLVVVEEEAVDMVEFTDLLMLVMEQVGHPAQVAIMEQAEGAVVLVTEVGAVDFLDKELQVHQVEVPLRVVGVL
jgi:hypothetical protein